MRGRSGGMLSTEAAVDVRRAVANYLAGGEQAVDLYDRVIAVFASVDVGIPGSEVVNEAYGLLVAHHDGILNEDALRDALRPLVTHYSLVWSLLADSASAVTGASQSLNESPIQRPLLRVFDTPREAVPA